MKKKKDYLVKLLQDPKIRLAYQSQRCTARKAGIGFLLTLEEWLKIWQDSGHLHERGRRTGQYCMCRFGDKGPYAIGNVRIATRRENNLEYIESPKGQRILRKFIKVGSNPSTATRRKISLAGKGKPKPPGFGEKVRRGRERSGVNLLAPKGVDNANALIKSMKTIRAIRQYYEQDGVRLIDISKRFGVSISTASNIVRQQNYVETRT